MSERVEVSAAGTASAPSSAVEASRRRRAGGSRRRRPIKKETTESEEEVAEVTRERKERPAHVPSVEVPSDLIGKAAVGEICDIIKRGRGKFGFIYIGEGEFSRSETPRIYFNFKDYDDKVYLPRRGYSVEFVCKTDESNRPYAAEITLTAKGLEQAQAREAKISSDGAPKVIREVDVIEAETEKISARRRRPRRNFDDRSISLVVQCDGKGDESKIIDAKLSQSIGKLKHSATKEFDAPHSFNIYCQITPANPEGILLTKAILKQMADNDVIYLKESAIPSEEKP